MERDFMGLAVKQETPDEIIDAAPVRSLPMQWSFSNKGSASALPQLLSFQNAQEDNRPKTDPIAQKNIIPDKQGGIRYTVNSTFPTQRSLAISSTMATSLHQPLVAPLSTPSNSPIVGTTDLRSSFKISNSPAQLTIFYNGSVCVYDNVSPEKAQAIMLLAGNGPPMGSSPTPPVGPVQASMPRSSSFDGFAISKQYSAAPGCSSPVTTTPIAISQSGNASGGIKNDTTPAKPAGVIMPSSAIAAQPLKAVNPLGPVSVDFLPSDTVPQFRRKSLARFLEKRKERAISASPYGSPDCSSPGKSSRHSTVSAIN